MSIIDKLKAEIERLKKETKPQKGQGIVLTQELCKSYDYLLSFLNTLKVQPVCDGLEEELDSWRNIHFRGKRDGHYSGEYLTRDSQLDLAHHFAQWMREKMMKEEVEGRVCAVYPLKYGNDVQYGVLYPKGVLPHKDGDRVKLIIIEEDAK